MCYVCPLGCTCNEKGCYECNSNTLRYTYKAFRSKNIFNKPNIKKIPKIFKKLPMGYKFLGSTLARDSSINALALIYDLMSLSHDLEYKMTYSSVLTLQN